jgi:hypothetical protein
MAAPMVVETAAPMEDETAARMEAETAARMEAETAVRMGAETAAEMEVRARHPTPAPMTRTTRRSCRLASGRRRFGFGGG